MESNVVAFWVSGISGLAIIALCFVAYYRTATTGEDHLPNSDYAEPLAFIMLVAFVMGIILTLV